MNNSSKPTILFVDDEADLLAGIRLALRRERAIWDIHFADGAASGLTWLESHRPDVVVSDMRMPGMDGATFLGRVRNMCPQAVRIVLTGQADEMMALRAIPVSHRWLTKPCGREQLLEVLGQAVQSRQFLREPALCAVLGDAAAVPSLPRIYDELMHRIAQPDFGLDEIAGIVGRDPGMAARVLQLANSALFRRNAPLTSLTDAVAMLGLRTLSHLLLAAEVFVALQQVAAKHGDLCARIEERALRMSRLCGSVFTEGSEAALLASTAGLLHEVGSLVLLQHDPERYRRAATAAATRGIEPDAAEREVFGTSHAEVGAALLCMWGLPMDLVEALLVHHRPERHQLRADTASAVRLAEIMVAAPWLEPTIAQADPAIREAWQRACRNSTVGAQ